MEEDIKILENLKEYLQMLIDNGIHKIQYNELWHDEKTVDCINALENLIKGYRELEKENESKEKAYNDCYCEFKHYKQYESIPKSKLQEKKEELEEKKKRYGFASLESNILLNEIRLLNELMEDK